MSLLEGDLFLGPGVLYIPLSARYSKISREYSKYFWPKFSKSSLKVTASTDIGTQKKKHDQTNDIQLVFYLFFLHLILILYEYFIFCSFKCKRENLKIFKCYRLVCLQNDLKGIWKKILDNIWFFCSITYVRDGKLLDAPQLFVTFFPPSALVSAALHHTLSSFLHLSIYPYIHLTAYLGFISPSIYLSIYPSCQLSFNLWEKRIRKGYISLQSQPSEKIFQSSD